MNEHLDLWVVDDEMGMRMGIARALRSYSTHLSDLDADVAFRVSEFDSGEACVEAVSRSVPNLVLLDFKLPGIDGIEVMRRLQESAPDATVIMMTAYASLDVAVQATKSGAFDFLAKPFTPQEVRAAVRHAARNHLLARRAKELVAEKRRIRFEFISVLSHELKAPIGAVEGYLRLIRSGTIKDEETLMRVVDRSIARLDGMRKLIFDILDMTRIESVAKKRSLQVVQPAAVVRNAIELVEVAAADRNIAITADLDDAVRMVADPSELDILVNNLVSNAVKYNREGGSVTVVLRGAGDRVELRVADTGIGLKPHEKGKLFGEFVRIKNDKTVHIEGSGLGLSTVKKIVDLYGGSIRVDSTWDVGTTFTVSLPAGMEGGEQSHE